MPALDVSSKKKYGDLINRVFTLMQDHHPDDFRDIRGYHDTPRESYKEFPMAAMRMRHDRITDVGVRKRDHNATFELVVIVQSFQRDNNALFLYDMANKVEQMLDQNPHLVLSDDGLVRRAWVTDHDVDLLPPLGRDVLTVLVQMQWIDQLPQV